VSIGESVVLSSLPQPPLAILDEMLWTFTVFVFRVDGGRPAYAGTPTCVTAGGAAHLSTAAHVWEALRRSSSFAVSLGPEKLLIEIPANSVGSRALFDKGPGEWGPDLAPIRLPDLIVSDIVREKAFFRLDRPRPEAADEHVLSVVIGAPAEQSTFSQSEAVLRLSLFDTWTVRVLERDGYATEEHRQKVMRTGFQKHLEKPVAPAELVTEVARLAGRLDGIPCR